MAMKATLFDDLPADGSGADHKEPSFINKKEEVPVDRMKNLEDKIAAAVERVKSL